MKMLKLTRYLRMYFLKQNDISIVIPSTFGNLKGFNTYPDIFIEEDLKKIIEELNKRAISNDYTLN